MIFPILHVRNSRHRIPTKHHVSVRDGNGRVKDFAIIGAFLSVVEMVTDGILFIAEVVMGNAMPIGIVQPIVTPRLREGMVAQSHVTIVVVPKGEKFIDRRSQGDEVLDVIAPQKKRTVMVEQ